MPSPYFDGPSFVRFILGIAVLFIIGMGCSKERIPTGLDSSEGLHNSISGFESCPPYGIPGPDSLVSDPAPDNRFNIRVRMSKEFDRIWNPEHNHIIGAALDKWESIILERPTSDVPLSGETLPTEVSFAEFTMSDEEYFGEYELEILMVYLPNMPGWVGATSLGGADFFGLGNGKPYLPISFFAAGQQFATELKTMNERALYLVLLHEFGHALGFSGQTRSWAEHNKEIGGRFGRSCGWSGPNSLFAWNSMLALDRPDDNVPLELDCGHWDFANPKWRRIHDVMFFSLGRSTAHVSPVTVGYFQDLGFAVNYENADEVMVDSWGARPAGKGLADLPKGFEFDCDINWMEDYGIDLSIDLD